MIECVNFHFTKRSCAQSMKITLRKNDYIISFVVILGLLLFNMISDAGNWVDAVLKSLGIAFLGSLVIGSFTNVFFGRRRE